MSDLIYGSFGRRDDRGEPPSWWENTHFQYIECYLVQHTLCWEQTEEMQWFNEIWLVQAGRCYLESGERAAVAGAGDVVVIPAGSRRVTRSVGDEALRIFGFHFSLSFSEARHALPLFDLPLCLPVADASSTRFELSTLFAQLIKDTVEQPAGYNFAAPALAQLILGEVVSAARPTGETPLQSEARMRGNWQKAVNDDIARVLNFIHAAYARPLAIEDLARVAHLSVPQMARKFKVSLGMSPMDYVRVHRLSRAHEQLRDSTRSIAQVAFDCGFEDPSYFSRQFKASFGFTPSVYRKNNNRPLA